ncbi:P-loop containing nucleoside triphosphate hydrolase protein [Gorgonomyces haynaldii]|nr:P-loop containing nucleoside triphosphate hydrolase protein [Gorgonomyces haynaldii]
MKNLEVKQVPTFTNADFTQLGLTKVLVEHLKEKMKIAMPTPIQKASLPLLIQPTEKDFIIQAQTGSGKTLSFLLPILHRIISSEDDSEFFSRTSGTLCMVLVPTRELAQQIYTVLEDILRYTSKKHWIVPGIIIGGEKRKSEKSRLRKGVTILVCTPGRLLDHLKTTDSFNVSNLRWLVLDEADNLLHLGFEETLKEILEILERKRNQGVQNKTRALIPGWPLERQTVLCSATIAPNVQHLANIALQDPMFVKAEEEKQDADISVPQQLQQFYVMAPAKLRLVSLLGLLRMATKEKGKKVIVFVATGDAVDWHFDALVRCTEQEPLKVGGTCGFLPNSILYKLHGSMSQQERMTTFQGFCQKKSESAILFCTDVAARGLDLPDVSEVVQYDPPSDSRDYIHRIGRTARLGRQGKAFLFLMPSEVEYLELLEGYKISLQEQSIQSLLEYLVPLATSKSSKMKPFELAATDVHMILERFVQSDESNKEMAQKAFTSAVRAYATHVQQERHIFHIKKLHLGHLAKAFALRDPPQQLMAKIGNQKKPKESTGPSMRQRAKQMMSKMMTSEFAAN